MSVTITTDVFCDVNGDQCAHWTNGVTASRSDTPGARRIAKDRGWRRCTIPDTGKVGDVCPPCFREVIDA